MDQLPFTRARSDPTHFCSAIRINFDPAMKANSFYIGSPSYRITSALPRVNASGPHQFYSDSLRGYFVYKRGSTIIAVLFSSLVPVCLFVWHVWHLSAKSVLSGESTSDLMLATLEHPGAGGG